MTPGEERRHRRLTELFVRAVVLDDGARGDFLRALQGGDRELRFDLEALLANDEGQEGDDPPVPRVGLE